MKEKIVLGLSGGVDSAVAARLLQERYEVTGLYLDIGLGGTGAADAAAVAERLGIRFADAGKWDVSLAYDGVHFTEQGHRAFAAGLLEELK